jgi:hypothetical protein
MAAGQSWDGRAGLLFPSRGPRGASETRRRISSARGLGKSHTPDKDSMGARRGAGRHRSSDTSDPQSQLAGVSDSRDHEPRRNGIEERGGRGPSQARESAQSEPRRAPGRLSPRHRTRCEATRASSGRGPDRVPRPRIRGGGRAMPCLLVVLPDICLRHERPTRLAGEIWTQNSAQTPLGARIILVRRCVSKKKRAKCEKFFARGADATT